MQFAINAFSVALPDQLKNLAGMRLNTSSNWLSDDDYLDPSLTTPNITDAVGASTSSYNSQAGVSVGVCGIVGCLVGSKVARATLQANGACMRAGVP